MPIALERLKARKEELTFQMEQARQQFVGISGAIADIDYWIKEAETGEEAPPSMDPITNPHPKD